MELTSYEPYWLKKNGLRAVFPSLQNDIDTEILIIGGGITGALIAHQCISEGYTVCVADARDVCTGSTSATTSMLQYEIDVPLHKMIKDQGAEKALLSYRACSKAIFKLKDIVSEIDSDCGFNFKKSLLFASSAKKLKELQEEYRVRSNAGFSVNWLDADQIDENYGLKNSFGGILSEVGGSVDAYRLAADLLNFNTKRGLEVFDKTRIKSVDHSGDYNVATAENGSKIKCGKTIYCTGYEVVNLMSKKIVNLLNTFALVSERSVFPSMDFEDTLFWNTDRPYIYFRTTDDGRLLIGGEDVRFKNATLRNKLIPKKTRLLEAYIEKHIPDFKHITDHCWAGTFGETKDGLPCIGPHGKFPNSYFVLGFGGNGITFSVSGMEMVTSWLKGSEHELAPVYSFDRL